MRTSHDREQLAWRFVVACLGAALVLFAAVAMANVRIQPAPPRLVEKGARYEFLAIWGACGDLPLGCEWWQTGDRDPFRKLAVACSFGDGGVSVLTAHGLVCSQKGRFRRSLERKYGIDCGGE